mgnify:CR=1 FL=1
MRVGFWCLVVWLVCAFFSVCVAGKLSCYRAPRTCAHDDHVRVWDLRGGRPRRSERKARGRAAASVQRANAKRRRRHGRPA